MKTSIPVHYLLFICFLFIFKNSSSELIDSFEDTSKTFRIEREIVSLLADLETLVQTKAKKLIIQR